MVIVVCVLCYAPINRSSRNQLSFSVWLIKSDVAGMDNHAYGHEFKHIWDAKRPTLCYFSGADRFQPVAKHHRKRLLGANTLDRQRNSNSKVERLVANRWHGIPDSQRRLTYKIIEITSDICLIPFTRHLLSYTPEPSDASYGHYETDEPVDLCADGVLLKQLGQQALSQLVLLHQ